MKAEFLLGFVSAIDLTLSQLPDGYLPFDMSARQLSLLQDFVDNYLRLLAIQESFGISVLSEDEKKMRVQHFIRSYFEEYLDDATINDELND